MQKILYRSLQIALLSLAGCPPFALAQPSGGERPSEPVLRRAPRFACWTIAYTYLDEEKASPSAERAAGEDRVASVTVTKTGRNYFELTIWRSGRRTEKWIFDGVQLMTAPDNSGAIVPVPAPTEDAPQPDYAEYGRDDFPDLSWISTQNFRGLQQVQGKSVFVFESAGEKRTAALAAETQLPLTASDGHIVRTYRFEPSPTEPLVLPPRFQEVLRAWKEGTQALTYRPNNP